MPSVQQLLGGASAAGPTQLNMIPQLPTITDIPTGGQFLQSSPYNEQQLAAYQNLLTTGQQRLQNPAAGFEPFAQRARQQFQSNIVPSIAERFTSMGGGQRSSAFQGALGSAASDLESQLAQAGGQYGLQTALQMIQQGLTPQYQQAYYQPSGINGILGSHLGETLPILGQLLAKNMASGQPFKQALTSGISSLFPSTATVADTAASVAAPVVGSAIGAGLSKAATAIPAAVKAAGPAAAATASPAAVAALAKKAATSAAPTAGAGVAATAAKGLGGATLGAIAMPIAVAGLFGWWLKELLSDED